MQKEPRKYLIYFVSAFITCYLTQVVLLNRLIPIGHTKYITGGCFIYFLAPLIIDVVAEVYGYRMARKVLFCGLGSLLFMGACVELVLHLPEVSFWHQVSAAYDSALGSLFRATWVSAIAIFVGQYINAYLISRWKVLTRGRYFWMRSVGSSVIGDTLTIVISMLLIFWGRITPDLLVHTFIPLLILMLIFSSLGAIPASYLARFVARGEGLDQYNIGVQFNPFR